MPVDPIRPDQVAAEKQDAFPDVVLDSFNTLIAKNFSNGRAIVKQSEVIDLIIATGGHSRQEIFDNHWLDVKEVYERAGWKVEYDKPGFNETYSAFFTFSKAKDK